MKKYSEKHRPQFHFSPPIQWMNDPNGMVYNDGEYHLFYQYHPESTVWGPMHWGHAISRDLVHWEHLPVALYPDELGYIFSGSAIVDINNTSGLGTNDHPPMIAIYSYHDPLGEKSGAADYQTQGLAYSLDQGRTWTKYKNNPIIPNTENLKDFRDPKVIWDEIHQVWLMVIAVNDRVRFYTSSNLIEWTYKSEWGHTYGDRKGVWECPDLFPIVVDDTTEVKWVLLLSLNLGGPNGGSGTQYFVGDWNGATFILDKNFEADIQDGNGVWIDYGRDNYAGVTWSGLPNESSSKIFLGWMCNWDYAQKVPTTPWRSAMTIPRSLTLRNTSQGYRLFSNPHLSLQKLRKKEIAFENLLVNQTIELDKEIESTCIEIVLEVDLDKSEATNFGIQLSNTQGQSYIFGFDRKENAFYSDRQNSGVTFDEKFAPKIHTAPRHNTSHILTWHIFIDVASIEIFADSGETTITEIFFPTSPFSSYTFFTKDGDTHLRLARAFELEGIW